MRFSAKTVVRYFIKMFNVLMDEYLKSLIINNRVSQDNVLMKYGSRMQPSIISPGSGLSNNLRSLATKQQSSFGSHNQVPQSSNYYANLPTLTVQKGMSNHSGLGGNFTQMSSSNRAGLGPNMASNFASSPMGRFNPTNNQTH